jgi:hypothetical protein
VHTLDVILYIIAVACFAFGAVECVRTTPFTRLNIMIWLFIGLLAWVLVPALSTWGVN